MASKSDPMTEETPEYSVQYKIILLGDSAVGKTAIIDRYCKDLFIEDSEATIGLGFQQKFIKMNGKTIKLAIWDTAGQEKYRTLTKSFYRNINGAILVYDITNPESLASLENSWIPELENSATGPFQKMVVGNKLDLREEGKDCVTTQQGEDVARKQATLFVETSAKSAEHVVSAFEELVARIMEDSPNMTEESTGVNVAGGNGGDDATFCC